MTEEEIFDRLFGSMTGIQPWKLTKGLLTEEQFLQMGSSFDRPDRRAHLRRRRSGQVADSASGVRHVAFQMQHPLDLLVIDYLQLIDVPDRRAAENQTQRMTQISQSIKQLAGNRSVRFSPCRSSTVVRTPDKRPQLSDLRDSGSIEQDADRVLMIYRDSYYNEDTDDPEITDLYIRKNRHGPIGNVELRFDMRTMSFSSVQK